MNNKNKKSYLAPQLTAVSFKSERGFANSTGESVPYTLHLFDGYSTGERMELYSTRSGWGNDNNNSFWGN